jgi:hypothetical protein
VRAEGQGAQIMQSSGSRLKLQPSSAATRRWGKPTFENSAWGSDPPARSEREQYPAADRWGGGGGTGGGVGGGGGEALRDPGARDRWRTGPEDKWTPNTRQEGGRPAGTAAWGAGGWRWRHAGACMQVCGGRTVAWLRTHVRCCMQPRQAWRALRAACHAWDPIRCRARGAGAEV